jgi:two-component system phosphate regulon response regulator PhoB
MSTVLVVDDDPDVRQILRSFIELEGHRVIEACDAAEARAVLAREKVALVILDVMMPGESGPSLCHAIKEAPETRDIKVVILTGYDGEHSWREGLFSGADVFALKPANRERIKLLLQELLPPPEGNATP